jgi:hypothetical protein
MMLYVVKAKGTDVYRAYLCDCESDKIDYLCRAIKQAGSARVRVAGRRKRERKRSNGGALRPSPRLRWWQCNRKLAKARPMARRTRRSPTTSTKVGRGRLLRIARAASCASKRARLRALGR